MKTKRLTAALLAASALAVLPAPVLPAAAAQGVCINEVCSQNKHSLPDSLGKYPDWIELYNAGSTAADLSGWGLSDSTADPMKFTFPAGTSLAPGGYLVVLASSVEGSADEIRTGFSISKNGETLTLAAPDGTVTEKVEVPTLGEDMTFGRTPDGSDTMEIMEATPGKANAAVVSAPTFSREAWFYISDFELELSAAQGTEIYYTTDGTDPTRSNTAQRYSGAITIRNRSDQPNVYSAMSESESATSICRGIGYKAPSYNVPKGTVVRAAAKDSSGRFSSVVSRTFFVTTNNRVLEDCRLGTVVSIVTDPDNLFDPDKGIYVTGTQYMNWRSSGAYDPNKSIWDADNIANYFSKGKEWERPADITIFRNSEAVVEQTMGLRIKGASTRNHAHKSFNLFARSEYGASKINYDFAHDVNGDPITKYDSLSLRAITDEARLNDSLSQWILIDRDDLALQAQRPCTVFVDGEYWGMYMLSERISDYFIESHYGVPKQDVAILKNGEPEAGPASECENFLDFADKYAAMDLTNEANYKAVCDYIDIDSMIDHYAAGLFLGTYDWPNSNSGAWRNTGTPDPDNPWSDGKWRFITYDLDYTLGATYADFGGVEGYAYNSFLHMEREGDDAPTNLFLALLKNQSFREKFINVYCDYNNAIVNEAECIPRVNSYSANYSDMVAQSLLRWWGFYGDSPSGTLSWNRENYLSKIIPGLEKFFRQRNGYTMQHMQEYLHVSSPQQTITISANGKGKIKINSLTPQLNGKSWSGKYYADVPVTLTAIPNKGYAFTGWEGGASGTEQTITVTLREAMTIQANFAEQKQLPGDVNADGSLTIADAVALHKWLLGSGTLADWQAGDLNADSRLTAADLSALKRLLLK